MKITIEPLAEGAEEEIIIRSDTLDPELMELIYALKAGRSRLTAYSGNDIVKLAPSEIYYFESVDNRVCVCCERNVYEVKQKLYELEKIYDRSDFLRISKAMIANVSKISRLAPIMGGRLEALLDNGEKVIISRQYVPDLKKKLGV